MKFDYAFFCLKNVIRIQILFKMNEKNVLIFFGIIWMSISVTKIKKTNGPKQNPHLENGQFFLAEYLAEFHQYIKNPDFDIDKQNFFSTAFFFHWGFETLKKFDNFKNFFTTIPILLY